MLSIKPIVYKQHRRADGLFAVKIRVTWQRASRYFDTPFTATAQQLTRNLDGFRDYRLLSAICKVTDQWRELLDQNAHTLRTIDDVVRIIKGERRELPTVADFGGQMVRQMRTDNRQHTAANYLTAIQRLNEFAPGTRFADLTVPFLKKYEGWLAARMGARGVQLYLSCLRKIYNAAIEEFNADGIDRLRRSPFEFYKIPEPSATKKRALTVDQLCRIIAHQPTDRAEAFARDVFLLSFCFCGINTIDLFTLDQLTADTLAFNRSKTKAKRKDAAYLAISIQPVARPLVERYRDGKRFNFAQTYSTAYNFNRAVNKGLKKMGAALGIDNLQFYAARHTWATIARNDCEVPIDDVAMALCHSQRTVTDIYIRRDFSRVDAANARVLDYCFSRI